MVSLNIDIRFADLEYELWAFKEYMDAIEEEINHLNDQKSIQTQAQLSADGLTPEDPEYGFAHQYLNRLTEEIVPRFARGPLLISLWALFETSIDQLARYVANDKDVVLMIRDINGRTFKEKWDKYFNYILRYPLPLDTQTWQRLDEIRIVRNCYAHANGQLQYIKENDENKLRALVGKTDDLFIDSDYIILTKSYLQQSFQIIDTVLKKLIQAIKADFSTAR